MPLLVFNSAEEWASHFCDDGRTAVTVGNFDGLHLGHQKILSSVRERARATRQRAAVITFDPHPMRVLRPENAPLMIQTLAQRLEGFERMGLDAAVVLRFDRELAQVSAEDFVERILVRCLRAGCILVGANFRFGHRGAGDVRLLEKFGKHNGFEVEVVSPVRSTGRSFRVPLFDPQSLEAMWPPQSSSGSPIFAERRNTRRGRTRAHDSVPYSEPGSRAGVASEARSLCDRIRHRREDLRVGHERGDPTDI